MAMGLTANELRTNTEDELGSKLAEAKEELFNLRFQGATGQLENHGRLHAVRKEIARIYTVMRERELGIVVEVTEEPEAASEPAPEPESAPAPRRGGRKTADAVDAETTGDEEADANE
jgi:large subunit ribosomal protein L29